jgi:hypothetical protein
MKDTLPFPEPAKDWSGEYETFDDDARLEREERGCEEYSHYEEFLRPVGALS